MLIKGERFNYISKNDIIADLHTHTIYSKHAHSTIKENLDVASQRGIKYVAMTDHFYCPADRIEKKNEIVRSMYAEENINHDSVKIISGAEFNLNHMLEGVESIKVQQNIHWRLFGFHTWFLNPSKTDIKDVPDYFSKFIECGQMSFSFEDGLTVPRLKDDAPVTPTAFAHIERELYKCKGATEKTMRDCLAAIVDIAAFNHIILEINESSIRADENGGVERMKFWINYAKEKNCIMCLGSDAHYCNRVGDFSMAIDLLNTIGISQYQIVNTKAMESELKRIISAK